MLFLSFLLVTVRCNNYLVPSYFGYLDKNFFLYDSLTRNKLKILQLQGSIDYVNSSLVFYARRTNHVLTVANPTTKCQHILVGKLNSPGRQVGRVQNTLLNGPSAVAFFKQCKELADYQGGMKVILTRNATCDVSLPGCNLTLYSNITFDNVRFVPTVQLKPCTTFRQFVIVSDSENHCIKKIDLKTKLVSVVAGRCGYPGFSDGPLAFSRLNKPREIGVTASGQIIFYDSGNQYVRLVKDGYIYSLVNGACRYYDQKTTEGGSVVRRVACYVDWIQSNIIKNTREHWFKPQETVNICKQHYSRCVKN